MPDGFWLGVAATIVAFVLCALTGWLWRRHIAWRDFSRIRFIPPPRVGRWQVWRLSSYPAGGETLMGRYRLALSARLVAWAANRSVVNPAYSCETRRSVRPLTSIPKES